MLIRQYNYRHRVIKMSVKKLLNKKVCLIWLFAAFVYGIILPFFWGNDPWDSMGTLSILCENHKPFFWLWVLVCCGGNLVNTNYMYKKYNNKNKALVIISLAAFVAACGIAATLGHSVLDWNPKRVAHWICTGLYIALLGVSVGFFGLLNIKKGKGYAALFLCVIGIVVFLVVWLLTLGKSAVFEMIPYALLQTILFLVNFTNVFRLKTVS